MEVLLQAFLAIYLPRILSYVLYSGSDTVSVIDTSKYNVTDNTYNVTDIRVGNSPINIFDDPSQSDAIYVANSGSNGVSVINSIKKEVVAGVTFDINPFRSGEIVCDTDFGGLDAPLNRILYLTSGANCVAKPNKGFEFASWAEALGGNSTRTISSNPGTSTWTIFLDLFNIKLDDPVPLLLLLRFLTL